MFSIREAFKTGWRVFAANTGFLIGVHLIALGVQTLPQLLAGDSPGLQALVVIVSMLGSFVVALGLVRIGLNLIDGVGCAYGDLFSHAHLVFKYLIASLLHGLASASVFVLLGAAYIVYRALAEAPFSLVESPVALVVLAIVSVIPGAFLYARFSQWPFLMVEHGYGPIRSMQESSKITEGVRGHLVLLFLAMIPLGLAGLLALLVGFVVSYAVITVATAYVYRQLQSPDLTDRGVEP